MSETATQTRTEWLQERQKGIGGSDAAAACGMSPWKTPYQLFLEKTAPVGPDNPTDAMLWGHLLEPVIRRHYCDTFGHEVIVPAEPFIHPEHAFMRVNLDGVVIDKQHGERRILECKTSCAWMRESWGEQYTDEIPEYYMLQAQHEIACTPPEMEIRIVDFAVLVGGSDFRIYHVERNDELIAEMVEAERKFWECVETRTPPEPENEEDVRIRWSKAIHGTMADADDELFAAWEELGEIRERQKQLEDRRAAIELEMKKQIRDMDGLAYQGKPLVTWKGSKRKGFDKKACEAKYPEIVKEFTTENDVRTFLYKKAKAAKK